MADDLDSVRCKANVRISNHGSRRFILLLQANLQLVRSLRGTSAEIVQVTTGTSHSDKIEVLGIQIARKNDSHASIGNVDRVVVFDRKITLLQRIDVIGRQAIPTEQQTGVVVLGGRVV